MSKRKCKAANARSPCSELLVRRPVQLVKRALRPAYNAFRAQIPMRWQVQLDYLRAHGRLPNLKKPQTFNEKMAFRKLFERDVRFPELMDKIKVKQHIAITYGDDLIIPTLSIYEKASELDFKTLPLSAPPYVIKANHGSSLNVFVKDNLIDQTKLRKRLQTWLDMDFSKVSNEWGYSTIAPRLLVEPYLGGSEAPTDYKFHVFSGIVYAIEVIQDRFGGYWINFYNQDWSPLNIWRYAGRPRSEVPVPPPRCLDRMLSLAESIGRDFSYVRVDLYSIGNELKVGELTFYAGSAFDRFEPAEWDRKFGDQWQIGAPPQRLNHTRSAAMSATSERRSSGRETGLERGGPAGAHAPHGGAG